MSQLRAVMVDYDSDLARLRPDVLEYMVETLEKAGAQFVHGQFRSEADALPVVREADVAMIQTSRPIFNAHLIPELTRCRGLIRMGIGYDSIDVDAATAQAIPVSNVPGWCYDEVAEHALGLLLACGRHLGALDRHIHAGGWNRAVAIPTHRLHGKTVGIVGLGNIGTAVARRLAGFGVTVLAADPYLTAEVVAGRGARQVTLAELLAQSDVITLHVPLTAETRCMIGPDQFAQMKPGVLIVNTSRGSVIDERALVAALQNGRVAGAALDVMEQEPLPAASPLRALDNVIMTPHLASYSLEAIDTLYRYSADIAAALLTRVWAPSIVNSEVRPRVEARWGAYRNR